MPLLVGTDGSAKMSKSLGNYIGLTEHPRDVFGKAMSIPDNLMRNYYELLLDRAIPNAPPVQQKRELGRGLVRMLHGEDAVTDAESTFDTVVRRGIPEDAPEVTLPEGEVWIVDLITHAGFAKTNGEARRFINGGAVRIDGEPIGDDKLSWGAEALEGSVLQVGKRRYARLISAP